MKNLGLECLIVTLSILFMLSGKAVAGSQLPTASLSASPSSIDVGQSSTLSWATSGARSVTLNGIGVASSGSQAVSPSITKSYTLVASNQRGSVTAVATVVVNTPQPVITSVLYSSLPWDLSPGQTVSVNGSGFVSGASSTFGSNPSNTCGFLSSVQLNCITGNPNGLLGPVDVVVTNPDGKTATFKGGFTYTVGVNLTPTGHLSVSPGEQIQFSAEVTTPQGLASDQSVVWSIQGVAGGTIDQNGLFTIPSTATSGQQFVIYAESNAEPENDGFCFTSIP